jgi:hypothetical protein
MLSPSDHCLRPVCSVLLFFGFKPRSTVPSRLPRLCTTSNDTGIPSTPPHGPPGPRSAPLQIQIDGPALAHVSPQPSGSPSNDRRSSSLIRQQQELTPGRPEIEQAPQHGALLGQPSECPSRSHPVGQDMFYQAHDFVMNGPVFVDNSFENCEYYYTRITCAY